MEQPGLNPQVSVGPQESMPHQNHQPSKVSFIALPPRQPPSLVSSGQNHGVHRDQAAMSSFGPSKESESTNMSIDDLNDELAFVCDSPELPYQEFATSLEPTSEEMHKIVCLQKLRPSPSARWSKFAPMRDYTILMRECWLDRPQTRLSALRVKKTLGEMARHYFNLNMD